MATMKRLGLEVLEDIHFNGPTTRKEMWERNQVCSWEMFKRLVGKLTVDGVIARELANPPATDPATDVFVLTAGGQEIISEIVQSLE